MQRVQCPHCQRSYRTKLEAFGRVAICTKCNQTFRIGESRPAFAWKPTDIAEDSWIGVEVPQEEKELKHCIMCDAPLDEGAVRCLACGANQVTGVVHRPRPQVEGERKSIGSVLPIRMLVLLAIVGAIGVGGYYAILAITRSTVEVQDELIDQRLVANAAKILRDTGDEITVKRRFAGKVNDQNLPRFIKMLSGTDASIRHAAALMIAAGEISDLEPVVAWAGSHDPDEDHLRVLHAISTKRFVELSGDKNNEKARRTAAEALCILSQLPREQAMLRELSEPIPSDKKIQRLNDLCRSWPEAVGAFVARIGGDAAGIPVSVEQVGRTFYLRVGATEFSSAMGGRREFVIPIEHWCAATGPGVDPTTVREFLGGVISLGSPLGVGWEGTVQATAKQYVAGALPGYLPIDPPLLGAKSSAEIRLERPSR